MARLSFCIGVCLLSLGLGYVGAFHEPHQTIVWVQNPASGTTTGQGMMLGQGYSFATMTPIPNECVQVRPPVTVGTSRDESTQKLVTGIDEYESFVHMNADLSASIGLFGATANVSSTHSFRSSRFSKSLVIHRLRWDAGEFLPSQSGATQFATDALAAKKFTERCGDGYIVGTYKGATLDVWFDSLASSEKDEQEVKTAVDAAYQGLIKGDWSQTQTLSSLSTRSLLSTTALANGFKGSVNFDNPDEVIAAAKEFDTKIDKGLVAVVIQSYDGIANSSPRENLAPMFNQLRALKQNIADRQYAQQWSERFFGFDKPQNDLAISSLNQDVEAIQKNYRSCVSRPSRCPKNFVQPRPVPKPIEWVPLSPKVSSIDLGPTSDVPGVVMVKGDWIATPGGNGRSAAAPDTVVRIVTPNKTYTLQGQGTYSVPPHSRVSVGICTGARSQTALPDTNPAKAALVVPLFPVPGVIPESEFEKFHQAPCTLQGGQN